VRTLPNGRALYGVERPVWDIEVEGAHEFFADGTLVHNSGYHRGGVYALRGSVVWCVKRYEFPDIRLAPRVVRTDFPRANILFISDSTAKDQVRHFIKELKRHNIFWIYRSKNPNIEDSAFLVNKLLYLRRLVFTKMAVEAAQAAAIANRDKNGQIPKGVGPSSPIHDVDHIRMVCYYLASNRKELNDVRMVTIARKQQLAEEVPEVEEMRGGYAKISPSALV
jgi:hypothetical protein